MNIKKHRTLASIITWQEQTNYILRENNIHGCYTPMEYGKRLLFQNKLFHKALYQIGIYTSFASTINGKPIYFSIKTGKPFFCDNNNHRRYIKSDTKVRYFRDHFYTTIDKFTPYIPDYLS